MNNSQIELKLPIVANMELVAVQTAEVIAKNMGLNENQAAEIQMAMIEACINAFEHSQSGKNIFIHFIITEDVLVIKIIDQGIGFDSSKVEIPKIENKLGLDKRKRGWGLQLMRELMDSVEFESTNEGTTVTMTKKKTND